MPDITMCADGQCPLRKTCYRYRAIPDRYQSYSEFPRDDSGCCGMYWNCGTRSDLRQMSIIEKTEGPI